MPAKKKEETDRMTIEQVAEFLEIHPRTVYYLIKRGLLTPHHAMIGKGRGGRRVYFDRAAVEALKGADVGPEKDK